MVESKRLMSELSVGTFSIKKKEKSEEITEHSVIHHNFHNNNLLMNQSLHLFY